MAKGYAEGPAAEEAERRREELASGDAVAEPTSRVAIEGCTPDEPDRHFLGWDEEIDADALFASGAAWGLRRRRRSV